MAGKIQLTPAELLAQSQEMLSLQQDFEALFQKSSALLVQVNGNWSENLANNFSGKLTSAQKSFSQIVNMLGQGGNMAATSANSFQSIDSLLAKNMSGDGWAVGSTNAAGYEDQNIIEFIFSDFERNPEIWEDFGKDIMKLLHIDIRIGEMILEDIKNGEFNGDTLYKIGSEIAKNWTIGKVVVGTLDNVEQLMLQDQEDYGQAEDYFEEGNILAGANTMIGSCINIVFVGSVDVMGDIVVDLWDDFPGTNMLEHVFGVDVSEEWGSFTKWAHEGVDEFTEATSEFIAGVEEGAREVMDTVVDFGKEVGEKTKETVEAIGDGLSDAADAFGDWVGSWW